MDDGTKKYILYWLINITVLLGLSVFFMSNCLYNYRVINRTRCRTAATAVVTNYTEKDSTVTGPLFKEKIVSYDCYYTFNERTYNAKFEYFEEENSREIGDTIDILINSESPMMYYNSEVDYELKLSQKMKIAGFVSILILLIEVYFYKRISRKNIVPEIAPAKSVNKNQPRKKQQQKTTKKTSKTNNNSTSKNRNKSNQKKNTKTGNAGRKNIQSKRQSS